MQTLKQRVASLIPGPIFRPLWLQLRKHDASRRGIRLLVRDPFFELVKGNRVLRVARAQAAYLPHIMENFEYYVDSVVPVPAHEMSLVDMTGPRYHRLKGFADIPFLFPSQTEPYATTAEYLDFANLKDGDIVLDLGAYAGVTSIIFGKLVGPRGHVYAFEADELNYECAKVNIETAAKVMGIANVTLLRKAVWSHSHGVLFSNEGGMGSSAVAIVGGKRGLERVVESVRLQDFFAEQGLQHVDFVKIDIEGGEVEVLKSSADFLHGAGAKLIVEPHLVRGALCTEQCLGILEAAGYKVRVRNKVGESEALIEAMP